MSEFTDSSDQLFEFPYESLLGTIPRRPGMSGVEDPLLLFLPETPALYKAPLWPRRAARHARVEATIYRVWQWLMEQYLTWVSTARTAARTHRITWFMPTRRRKDVARKARRGRKMRLVPFSGEPPLLPWYP